MRQTVKQVLYRMGYSLRREPATKSYFNLYEKYKDYTMVRMDQYIDNLHLVNTYGSKIKGDIVECGVWRGGMMAAIAEVLGKEDRNYYLFDSFEGLPPAKDIDGPAAKAWQENKEGASYFNNCSAEIDYADTVMKQTGCSYSLFKGWFSETLPHFRDKSIAVLRLDADWYESTVDVLTNLYDQVVEGGLIIIDDYYTWDGCSKAIHDYLSSKKSSSRINTSEKGIAYIIKRD